jgi:drug/metabolite transporter (DMT)-like permease
LTLPASTVKLFEPLVATILAWIFFGQVLGPAGFVGGILLVASLLLIVYGEQHKETTTETATSGV